jgi:hypothetical protein
LDFIFSLKTSKVFQTFEVQIGCSMINTRRFSLASVFAAGFPVLFASIAFGATRVELSAGAGTIGTTGNMISLSLANDREVVGIQFTLGDKLTALSLDTALVSERAQNFTIMFHGNKLILFSLEGKSIPAGEGKVLDLFFRVSDQAGSATDTLYFQEGPLLSSANGEKIEDIQAVPALFTILPSTGLAEKPEQTPHSYGLDQNYPNPFNPQTVIRFAVKKPGRLRLSIYDVLGHEIRELLNTQMLDGNHRVSFDGSDLPSGIYFYKMSINGFEAIGKMLLVR